MAEKATLKGATKGLVTNPAFEALAKTDDILAVIGIIILLGVVISAYSAYWTGRVAQAQYNKEFSKDKDKDNKKKNAALIIGTVGLIAIAALLWYIIKRNEKVTTIPVAQNLN